MTIDAAARAPRICVYTRAWRASGAGLFAQEMALGMVEAGAAVTYVAPPTANPAFEAPRAGLRRIRPVRERDGRSAKPVRAAFSLARMAGGALALLRARLSNRVFVVSIPDPLVVSVPVLWLLRLTGARIIFVAHDPLPHAWRLPARWRWLEIAIHGACYRLASTVVVLSEPSRDKLRAAFPALRTPVEVIEHGVFVLDRQTDLPGDGLVLAFGTLRRNKHVREAIEGVIRARARGVPVRLVIAGGIHPEDKGYAADCIALAETVPEAIDLQVGYVPDEALAGLIARVDALLMPYDAFFSQSGVALLAASNGRPVIATRAGGLATLIEEGMPGTVIAQPVTSDGVADAVERFFATDAATWRAKAGAYRQYALDRWSWAAIGRAYVALARRLGG